MQPKSIPEASCIEHEHTQTMFPHQGDNFHLISLLPNELDPAALAEAYQWLLDCKAALDEFERLKECTGTPK